MTDRKTQRLADWQTDRPTDLQTDILTDRQTNRPTDWQAVRMTGWQTNQLKDWQIDRQTDWHTDRKTDLQTVRLTDSLTAPDWQTVRLGALTLSHSHISLLLFLPPAIGLLKFFSPLQVIELWRISPRGGGEGGGEEAVIIQSADLLPWGYMHFIPLHPVCMYAIRKEYSIVPYSYKGGMLAVFSMYEYNNKNNIFCIFFRRRRCVG
jgi:hypothetical protein